MKARLVLLLVTAKVLELKWEELKRETVHAKLRSCHGWRSI